MINLSQEQKAGLLITAIVHVAVIIVLLIVNIAKEKQKENSFVLDFSGLEEIERLQKELELKEKIAAKLEAELSNYQGLPSTQYANIAVDRSSLKDDRGTDAEELYKEAERLAEELKRGSALEDFENIADPIVDNKKESEPKSVYTGPSVVSYDLGGRKASKLSIPAYRCMGSGRVTVLIAVDRQGTVLSAKIDESSSSKDGCLQSFALRAARLSKFSASTTAPSRQSGNIIYEFIAQ